MAIGFNFDFGREKRIQRAQDLSRQERREIQQEARGRDVAALTAASQDAPFSPIADEGARQAELGATVAQASPAAQEMLAQQQAALQPPSALDRAKLKKAQADAVTAQMGIQEKQNGLDLQLINLRNQEMTGGRAMEPYLEDRRDILEFGIGLQEVTDLRVMNRELGREVIPGAAKGTYDTKRAAMINFVGKISDAGAMSAEEIEFYKNYLPDFGVFASFSPEQRDAMLRTLEELLTAKVGTIVQTTKGASMPQPIERPIDRIIFGQPDPAEQGFEGFEPVEPEVTLENVINRLDEDVPQVGDFLDKVKESFGGSGRFR